MTWKPQYFDIGVNISELFFTGGLHHHHASHVSLVLARTRLANVPLQLVTSLTLHDSSSNIKICNGKSTFTTVGVHPCQAGAEFYTKKEGKLSDDEPHFTDVLTENYKSKLNQLVEIAKAGHKTGIVKAFGELGLDYDRLHFSSKAQQKYIFEQQLKLFSLLEFELPYFLHMRAACDDFIEIIKPFVDRGLKGVVHSFTGTEIELEKLTLLGFYISVNGCSLRTQENLDVAAKIPIEKLMIETDSPYCEFRKNGPATKLYITPYPNKFFPEYVGTIADQIKDLQEALKDQKLKQAILRQEENNLRQKQLKEGITNVKQETQTKKNSMTVHPFVPFLQGKSSDLHHYRELVDELASKYATAEPNLFADHGALTSPLLLGRNEPLFIAQVAQVVAGLHGIKEEEEIEKFIDTVYQNTCEFFEVPRSS